MSNKLHIKGKRAFFEGLVDAINTIINNSDNNSSNDDKLLCCVLQNLKLKIEKRLINYKDKYNIQLEHEQAIALKILYDDFIKNATTYIGNKLFQLTNQIHQHYY